MGVCITFAGCQSDQHRPDCAKFDQRTADLAEISRVLDMADEEWGYDADSGRAALDRLIRNDYREKDA